MANYIAVIHKDKNSEYGVSFPDFPGCVTAGETIDEAKDMAQEALELHVEGMVQDGESLPKPCSLEDAQESDAVAYFVVSVNDPKPQPVRINISIDKALLEQIDSRSRELGMTRSGFLAESARHELR